MPKKDIATGESIISESGNWNVASDFSKVKIMLPLAKSEYYEDIATFGYESIIEELQGYQIDNRLVRYTGLKRLINELLKLCKNCKFAMKKPRTKEELENLEKRLVKIKGVLPYTVNIKRNNLNGTQTLELKEDFDKILKIVVDIKSLINSPLNKNHLIFTDKEEFDPHAFKKAQKERMVGRG